MIPISLEQVAGLCEGALTIASGATEISGVVIDSRRVEPGDLFVVVGRGAEFTDQALESGAAAVLVPGDAEFALSALAGVVRERSSARVVAITGSTGKTSTKDILASLCSPQAKVVAAEASFNNELGIPLTLCRIESDTEIALVEIGMRGLGQIGDACRFVRPHIGLITSVGPVHLELLGTVERVAQAKAEVLSGLERNGVGIIPADEPLLEPFLPDEVEIRRFGAGGSSSLVSFEPGEEVSRAVFEIEGERIDLELPLNARHQALNALAALVAYRELDLPLDRAQEGARTIRLSRWRGEETTLTGGGLLINDAYNANPTSLAAALEHQEQVAAGRRRVAVLGTMAELGSESDRYHREIGRHAAELGVDAVLAVGEPARAYLEEIGGAMRCEWAPDADGAVVVAKEMVRPGDCVLVKGSRVVGLERVAEALAGLSAG
ncbi:MAG: UDP-N-acetylmuramoyl-tripeptide--D-alanyl-D-alanine ligase [Gaiellaceae bacterium]|jgi:UDP-N-acetylmuramoyl-tripeptide--D-alanyl-D-alanine ligase